MASGKTRIKNAVIKSINALEVTDINASVVLGSGDTVDLNGEADALIIDADGDTTISAPTDDQIDVEVGGADVLTVTASAVTAASGVSFVGQHIDAEQELTASGAITVNNGTVYLNHASVVIAATLDAPTRGDELIIIDSSATGTAAHTVTVSGGVTFNGTNTIATFNLLGEALHLKAISATRWLILNNVGSVGLSGS